MAPRPLRRPGGTAALTLALTAGTALGLVGAVAAYRSALGEPGTTTAVPAAAATPTSPAATEAPTPTDRPTTRWAPCVPPAVLEDGVCVTDVTRTVVVPGPAASRSSHDDDGYEEYHADDHGEHGDDHGEHGDDHGEHGDDHGEHGDDHGEHGDDHGDDDHHDDREDD
jgi:hypothetical protein